VSPHGFNGYKPVPEDHGMGEVNLNLQFAYVDGAEYTKFGEALVTANSIRVEPGYQELLVGDPVVSLRNRELQVGESLPNEVFEPSKCRVSPHTIWAMTEAPEQAKTNHPNVNEHRVDHDPASKKFLNIPGTPTVSLQHRRLTTYGGNPQFPDMSRYGKPTLTLGTNYIILEVGTVFDVGFIKCRVTTGR